MKQYRQGDVLIVKIDAIPEGLTKGRGKCVLAFGEVTGHSHDVDNADWWRTDEAQREAAFFSLSEPSEVKHQEHSPIKLEPGDYKVVHQREYTPLEIKRVTD